MLNWWKKKEPRNKFLDTLDSYSKWIRKNLDSKFEKQLRDILCEKRNVVLDIIPTTPGAWSTKEDLGNIQYVELFMELVDKHLQSLPYNLPKVSISKNLFRSVELVLQFPVGDNYK